MPNPVVFEALGKHTATVIFAHGLGDTASGWVPLAQALRSKFKHIKWVLPTAPVQPVSINMGMAMTSWFDIQVAYLLESQERVESNAFFVGLDSLSLQRN
jgi:predicted esterase